LGIDSTTLRLPLPEGIHFSPAGFNLVLHSVLIIVLFVIYALISGAEAGYYTLGSGKSFVLPATRNGAKIRNQLANQGRIMATILMFQTLILVGIVLLTTKTLFSVFTSSLPIGVNLSLTVLFITFLILVFGELLPKLIASRHPLKATLIMAAPLDLFDTILSPLNRWIPRLTYFAGMRLRKKTQNMAVAEISQALELAAGSDIEEEKEILEGIVNFGNKNVSEIMCPRVDVVAIDAKSSFHTVLDTINTSGYSRIPVYNESFDQVSGILYIKDLLPFTEEDPSFAWQKLLRPPFFVPETRKIKDLLGDFQKNKIHMALVVDEYGGLAGIVTLEDVLEEIVGDIADEFDEDESYFTKTSDGKLLFDGKILLEKFCEIAGCPKDYFNEVKGEADTLAGLILEIKGDIPVLQEQIDYGNFRFTIESVTNRRIRQIKTETL